HGVKLEGSMNYAKGKSWALLLSIYKWSRQRAPLEQKAASCKHYSKSSELRNKSEASREAAKGDSRWDALVISPRDGYFDLMKFYPAPSSEPRGKDDVVASPNAFNAC
ncbi:hypothetical protein Tco_0684060, partial [Tanacetum coccineum]